MTFLYIVLGLIAALVLYVILTYNALVSLRVRVNEAWSGIEVHMKERYNLIPNLIETVKGYTKHESETLQKVTRARAEAFASHGSPAEQADAENVLSGALKSLFALAEDYPDLKANTSFVELQGELSRIEEKIQNARRYYNGVVRDNNTKIDQFPSNLVANTMSFHQGRVLRTGRGRCGGTATGGRQVRLGRMTMRRNSGVGAPALSWRAWASFSGGGPDRRVHRRAGCAGDGKDHLLRQRDLDPAERLAQRARNDHGPGRGRPDQARHLPGLPDRLHFGTPCASNTCQNALPRRSCVTSPPASGTSP